MWRSKYFKLVFLTPVFLLLSHSFALLPHLYAHSFAAWLLGYKSQPFALNYNETNLLNLFFFMNMDENVNYEMIFSLGHGLHVAIIAFAGFCIANGTFFLLSLKILNLKSVKQNQYLYYFILLFNLMNLGNFYGYVPIRTFATHGDVANFTTGLNISPWWVYIIVGFIVILLIRQFFNSTLTEAYIYLECNSNASRAFLLSLCVLIIFGFFAIPGLQDYGIISFFIAVTSFLAIPFVLLTFWPKRNLEEVCESSR